jgi:Carboxypeptidase regulatory-like domain
VKHRPLLSVSIFFATVASVLCGVAPVEAQSNMKPAAGTLSGLVRDASGIPQLGATVEVLSEAPGLSAARQFLTNSQGFFRDEKLVPGFYTVRVTLAGFLPTLETHVRISANLTTMVRIQLESMFASLEQLRRPPVAGAAEADDWKWALRSSSGLRPILQWNDQDSNSNASVVMADPVARPRGRLELKDGASQPGTMSSLGASPSTAFAYDQHIDKSNHIVFAGQFSYDEDAPSGGIAAVWLPGGALGAGPVSTVVLREGKLGPNGPTFRAARIDQSGTIALGDRFLLRAGGEYVVVGLGAPAGSLRPRVKLQTKVSSNWYVDLIYATIPNATATDEALAADLTGEPPRNVLKSALDQLDAFPTLLWRNGKAELETGQHSELAVERKLGTRGMLQVAAFHDDDRHTALYGRGEDLISPDYFQDFDSKGFAYDGGTSSSWGTRVALRERISEDLEFTTIYAFSGALVPANDLEGALRDALRTDERHSLAAKITATIPRTRTHLTASYKWINGTALTRVDAYGEGVYQMSPYLNVGIRQPLPRFALGRWEANAECDNLLAQGYYTMNTGDGQILVTPSVRSFRGGLSLQF